ncbi:potassium voltage-gated channel subfamily E regulatory beta subunit 5, partial [Corvus kubaryi]|uniref:potassium voltage-gated channel subfamily E regulatory beta subunit 5 n=1 Tax=Corvus kubaryi TaxID=68294 RepID=UPI001C03D240
CRISHSRSLSSDVRSHRSERRGGSQLLSAPWQREPRRCRGCARGAPPRGAGATVKRSGARRLPALLGAVLRELRRAGNTSAGAGGSLYILLIIIFCGCRAGALIPAETRSRKLESKHDPSHLYTERDCGPGGPAQAAEQGGPAAGQRRGARRERRPALGNRKGPSGCGSASAALPPGDCGQRATAVDGKLSCSCTMACTALKTCHAVRAILQLFGSICIALLQ